MRAQKIQVKFFAESNGAFELEPFVPVLHEWIQQRALDELLIDVADYGHVHHGPGLLLVCHAADYYIDLGEGRLGLLYSRKHEAPEDPVERVVDALRRALAASKKLEDDPRLKVRFRGDEVLVRLNDRLLAPNDASTYAEAEPVLRRAFEKLYGDVAFTLNHEGSSRELFTVRVRAPGAPKAGELLARLA